VVAACGLAQGGFPAFVAPLILRGISIVAIESVRAVKAKWLAACMRLARDLDPVALDLIATDVGLKDAVEAAQRLMEGNVGGPHCRRRQPPEHFSDLVRKHDGAGGAEHAAYAMAD
jgi:hypothetical protein